MKISNDFSELKKENALFIVSGKQHAVMYRVRKGEMYERETIHIDAPKYSDREGYSETYGGNGEINASGSGYEAKDLYIKTKFLKTLAQEIRNLRRPYDAVYIFGPQYLLQDLKDAVPHAARRKIKGEYPGNFTKHHPQDLLEKIRTGRLQEEEHRALERATGEAAKILLRDDAVAA